MAVSGHECNQKYRCRSLHHTGPLGT